MKQCPKCGKWSPDSAVICEECGTWFRTPETIAAGFAVPEGDAEPVLFKAAGLTALLAPFLLAAFWNFSGAADIPVTSPEISAVLQNLGVVIVLIGWYALVQFALLKRKRKAVCIAVLAVYLTLLAACAVLAGVYSVKKAAALADFQEGVPTLVRVSFHVSFSYEDREQAPFDASLIYDGQTWTFYPHYTISLTLDGQTCTERYAYTTRGRRRYIRTGEILSLVPGRTCSAELVSSHFAPVGGGHYEERRGQTAFEMPVPAGELLGGVRQEVRFHPEDGSLCVTEVTLTRYLSFWDVILY